VLMALNSCLTCFARIILTVLLFTGTALSYENNDAEYSKGAASFSKGDYITALNLWLPLAQNGDPAAQYSIGLLYDQGSGVKKNTERAIDYLQSAADQGLPAAQYYLAIKYYNAFDVKKNAYKARQLLLGAAQQEHLKAQFQLANLYAKGEGGSENQTQATYWFITASENGYGPAQHSLAARFLTGKGTDVNINRGIFWLTKAVEQNNSDALRDLGFMYYKGVGVKKDYQQASKLLLLAAEENSALALFLLGKIYAQGGYGISRDVNKAKKWYKKAQALGYKEAATELLLLPAKAPSPREKTMAQSASIVANTNTVKTVPPKSEIRSYPASENLMMADNSHYFRQINGSYYTLQLLSTLDLNSISILTNQFFDKQTYILHTPKGNTAYILAYGAYKDRSAAQRAVQSLPEIFQLSKPWIRKVKDLQLLMSDE